MYIRGGQFSWIAKIFLAFKDIIIFLGIFFKDKLKLYALVVTHESHAQRPPRTILQNIF